MRDGRYGRGVWFRENGIIRGLENGPPLPVKITSCLNEAIVAMGLFKALLPIMIEDLLWAVEISRE